MGKKNYLLAAICCVWAGTASAMSDEDAQKLGFLGAHSNGVAETIESLMDGKSKFEDEKKWVMAEILRAIT